MKKTVVLGLLVIILAFGFIGCDDDDGDETFTSTTNEVTNDVSTLGLVGTSATSDDTGVATVLIDSGKVKITSVAQGSAVITVSDDESNEAKINVTVSKTGSISRTIVKYTAPEPYDGQIYYILIDEIQEMYIEGDPVTTISSGTIRDRRQNNVDESDPNVYINVGTITNNKVTLALPATVENSKLDNETGTYMGNFGSYQIVENSERIRFMCLSGEFAGDDLIFYTASAINALEYDDYTIDLVQGWNFFIQPFEEDASLIRVSSFEEFFEKGFKWYIRPSN